MIRTSKNSLPALLVLDTSQYFNQGMVIVSIVNLKNLYTDSKNIF